MDDERETEPHNGPLLGMVEQQQPAPPQQKQTIVFLDGLRGLAALCVYTAHNVSWYYDPDNELQDGFAWMQNDYYFVSLPFVRTFFTGGSAAVSIFFVLSGFVLSRSTLRMLIDSRTSPNNQTLYNNLLSATIRRPVRLFAPPIAVSFLVALSLHTPIRPLLNWPPAQDNIIIELGHFVIETVKGFNPFVEHAPFTMWYPYNPPIWTMPTEFNGSILVFALLAISVRLALTRRQRILVTTILGVILLYTGFWALSCFMAGMVLAMVELEGLDEPYLTKISLRARSILMWFLFFAAWYLLSEVANTHQPERSFLTPGWYTLTMMIPSVYYDEEYWRFWHSIGATMLVYAVLRIRWLQTRFAALKYLGKISFSFYLIHTPLLWILADRMYRIIGMRRPEQLMDSALDGHTSLPAYGPRGLTTDFLICQSVLLPITLILAQYATKYIDEPSMALSKQFSAYVMKRLGRSER